MERRRAEHNCLTAHKAPEAPYYYAVIFSSTLADDAEGYGAMADRMVELAREQEGFIDVESAARTSEGFGITVLYWRDLESIKKWKAQSEHAAAQRMGRDAFYKNYRLRIARVERECGFDRDG
jgi:heme-degrading monooxygenase HmoA